MNIDERIKQFKKLNGKIEKLMIAALSDKSLNAKIYKLESEQDVLMRDCSLDDRQVMQDLPFKCVYVIGQKRHWALMAGQRFLSKKNAMEYVNILNKTSSGNQVFKLTMREVS